MKILIAYDSGFGSTARIARAMGAALAGQHTVEVLQVHEVRPADLAGTALLILGSPTRGLGPSPAVLAFLDRLPRSALTGMAAAAFDTRILPGDVTGVLLRLAMQVVRPQAAPRLARKLKQRGARLVMPEDGFAVFGTGAAPKSGEIERAASFAQMAAEAAARPRT